MWYHLYLRFMWFVVPLGVRIFLYGFGAYLLYDLTLTVLYYFFALLPTWKGIRSAKRSLHPIHTITSHIHPIQPHYILYYTHYCYGDHWFELKRHREAFIILVNSDLVPSSWMLLFQYTSASKPTTRNTLLCTFSFIQPWFAHQFLSKILKVTTSKEVRSLSLSGNVWNLGSSQPFFDPFPLKKIGANCNSKVFR